MIEIVCPGCASGVNVDETRDICYCMYCGSKIRLVRRIVIDDIIHVPNDKPAQEFTLEFEEKKKPAGGSGVEGSGARNPQQEAADAIAKAAAAMRARNANKPAKETKVEPVVEEVKEEVVAQETVAQEVIPEVAAPEVAEPIVAEPVVSEPVVAASEAPIFQPENKMSQNELESFLFGVQEEKTPVVPQESVFKTEESVFQSEAPLFQPENKMSQNELESFLFGTQEENTSVVPEVAAPVIPEAVEEVVAPIIPEVVEEVVAPIIPEVVEEVVAPVIPEVAPEMMAPQEAPQETVVKPEEPVFTYEPYVAKIEDIPVTPVIEEAPKAPVVEEAPKAAPQAAEEPKKEENKPKKTHVPPFELPLLSDDASPLEREIFDVRRLIKTELYFEAEKRLQTITKDYADNPDVWIYLAYVKSVNIRVDYRISFARNYAAIKNVICNGMENSPEMAKAKELMGDQPNAVYDELTARFEAQMNRFFEERESITWKTIKKATDDKRVLSGFFDGDEQDHSDSVFFMGFENLVYYYNRKFYIVDEVRGNEIHMTFQAYDDIYNGIFDSSDELVMKIDDMNHSMMHFEKGICYHKKDVSAYVERYQNMVNFRKKNKKCLRCGGDKGILGCKNKCEPDKKEA